MSTHTVTGGGGVRLHVKEAGNRAGRPILFIHGFSQCSLLGGAPRFNRDLRAFANAIGSPGTGDDRR